MGLWGESQWNGSVSDKYMNEQMHKPSLFKETLFILHIWAPCHQHVGTSRSVPDWIQAGRTGQGHQAGPQGWVDWAGGNQALGRWENTGISEP